MAQVTEIRLIDDIDGSEAVETVRFALDDKKYRIDLNADHAKALRESFAEFIEHASKDAGQGNGRGPKGPKPRNERTNRAAVQEWAAGQGIEVKARGRIPNSILEQYEAAQSAA